MKAVGFAVLTILAWAYAGALMVIGFEESPAARLLDSAYPVAVVLTIGAIVVYVVDALRSSRVPSEKRSLWAVVLVLGHLFAQPFYWWFYVRRT